jgi:exodeoxyribonuclease VII small subunit
MAKASNWSYEAAIAAVETIIARLESGELDLAEVVDQFAEAAATLKTCEVFLREKRSQVELVIEQLQDRKDADVLTAAEPPEDDEDLAF